LSLLEASPSDAIPDKLAAESGTRFNPGPVDISSVDAVVVGRFSVGGAAMWLELLELILLPLKTERIKFKNMLQLQRLFKN
jgi:hypothetical protein